MNELSYGAKKGGVSKTPPHSILMKWVALANLFHRSPYGRALSMW
jgi:hypothetical protein